MPSRRWLLVCWSVIVFCGVLALSWPQSQAHNPRPAEAKPRRPVALALADKGRRLFVANQRSGSVTTIDTVSSKLLAETSVGTRLTDLAITPDGRHLLAVDEADGTLVVLRRREDQLRVLRRIRVSPTPASVQINADGATAIVASTWPRRLSIVNLSPTLDPSSKQSDAHLRTVSLPFAPGRQLLLGTTGKLVVADAFGGKLAMVDVATGTVDSVHTMPGHNIRGLALSQDNSKLLISHQFLHSMGSSSFDDIHWGNVLTNHIRTLRVADLLNPKADLVKGGTLDHVGEALRGAGDPAGVAVTASGKVLVTLAGVHELAIGPGPDGSFDRLAVGQRPTAVVATTDGRRAYVANTFSDSVSFVDVLSGRVTGQIALGMQPELSNAERGELLFYDARLSHDGWMSCQTCHPDGHTCGLLNDNQSDGSFGTPKRILTLRGVANTAPWAWNGSMPDLESQVRTSIEKTMQGTKPSREQVEDLAAFLRTLPPPPRAAELGLHVDVAAVSRGQAIFEKQGCNKCHVPPAYTSTKTYDVGLVDQVGLRWFNPPSLRGVMHGGPFFHDNRAATLEEVVTLHHHQMKDELNNEQVKDLTSFLRSL